MKITGYENYEVRPNGEVVNVKTGRILKPYKDKDGYFIVYLYNNNSRKTYRVHRLVAEAFIPNPDNLPQVNHKDENPSNNHVGNLEWCTAEYNINYGTHNKRATESNINGKKSKTVLQLRKDGSLVRVWPSVSEVKRQLNYNVSGIVNCCNGKPRYKTSYGYKWCYVS